MKGLWLLFQPILLKGEVAVMTNPPAGGYQTGFFSVKKR